MARKQKKQNSAVAVAEEKRKPKFLIIFVCVVLVLILSFGAVLAIIMADKKSEAAISFDGVHMEKGVASYFASRAKSTYISFLRGELQIDASDTPAFWNKDSGDGKKYGKMLTEYIQKELSWMMVTNYIYDSRYKLSSDDEKKISNTLSETLARDYIGSIDKFNEVSSKYGFNYDDYKTAVRMSYKAKAIEKAGGTELSAADKEAYISEYTHVKLLFIRTESTIKADENGNESEYFYNEEEKAAVAADIERIRNAISLIGQGKDGAMGEVMFNTFLKKYENDGSDSATYYFRDNEIFTKAFKSKYPDIVNVAYEMSVGGYSEAEYPHGVCFIYKCEPSVSDLSDQGLMESCLYNFNSNAMSEFYNRLIPEIGKGVTFNKKFEEIDILSLPYNSEFIPGF